MKKNTIMAVLIAMMMVSACAVILGTEGSEGKSVYVDTESEDTGTGESPDSPVSSIDWDSLSNGDTVYVNGDLSQLRFVKNVKIVGWDPEGSSDGRPATATGITFDWNELNSSRYISISNILITGSVNDYNIP